MVELKIVRDSTAAGVTEDGDPLPFQVLVLEDGSARLRFSASGIDPTRELRFSSEQRTELREALGA